MSPEVDADFRQQMIDATLSPGSAGKVAETKQPALHPPDEEETEAPESAPARNPMDAFEGLDLSEMLVESLGEKTQAESVPDELREQVINNSDMDLLGDLIK